MALNPFRISDSLRLLSIRKEETGNIYASQKSSVVVQKFARSAYTEDQKWEVEALPEDWEVKTGPSEKLERYLKNKKAQHEGILEEMRAKMRAVSLDVEEEIRSASSVLKKRLDDGERDVKELLVPLLPDRYKDFKIIDKMLVDAIAKVQQTCDDALFHVGKFDEFLECVERRRSDVFKCVLRKSYESLEEIAHWLPHDLQVFFEVEISKINEITLSNYRSYAELKMELALRVENNRRLWLQRLDALHNAHKGKQRTAVCSKSSPDVSYIASLFRVKADSLRLENLVQHTTEITNRLLTFDGDLLVLKKAIGDVIAVIVEQRYDEVQNVPLQFADGDANESLFVDLRNQVADTFFDSSESKDLSNYSDAMLVKWQSLLGTVDDEFMRAVEILDAVQHLWDGHFVRDYNLRAVTYASLDAMEQEYSLLDKDQLCSVNQVMERMREASTEQQLKELMVETKRIFDGVYKNMEENHAAKLKALKKFEMLARDECDLLRQEIDCFVEVCDKYPDVDPTIQHVRFSRLMIVQQEQKLPLMLIVENQLKALHNWMYGLTETITAHCLVKQNEYVMKKTADFVLLQRKKLENRLTLKSKLLGPKMERIYGAIYRVRLAELVRHEEIFRRHVKFVEVEMNRLKTAFSKDSVAWTEIVRRFSDEALKLTAKVPLTKSSLDSRALLNQLECVKGAHLKELYAANEEYQKRVDAGVVEVARLNLQYLKCLRLLNEGGNYGHGEVPGYAKAVVALNKSLARQSESIKKDVYGTWSSTCHRISDASLQFHETLHRSVEEHEFYEETVRHLQRLQAAIRKETQDLRRGCAMAGTYFAQLRRSAARRAGEPNYLDDFAENCSHVRSAFEGARQLLLQEAPFRLDPKALTNVKAYGMALFEKPPKGEDYMARILRALRESLDAMQAKAEEFYAAHVEFSHGKIAATLDEFMLEILAKHLFYQLQCEEAWLEISRDYILLTDKMLEFVRYFYTQCTNKYLESRLADFTATCDNFRRHFDERRLEIEDGYKKLQSKLKPLHGHPANILLFEELQEELTELNETVMRAQEEADASYDGIKNEIYGNVSDFESEVLTMERKLQETLGEYLRLAVRDETLAMQLAERIGYVRRLIDDDYIAANRSSENLLLGLNRRLNALKRELRLKSDDLKLMHDSLRQAKASLGSYSEKSSSANQLHIDDLIQIYKEKQMKCCVELGGRRNIAAISERWNEIWRNDIERIRGLYAVKYPCAQ